jgi:hypothetical protein
VFISWTKAEMASSEQEDTSKRQELIVDKNRNEQQQDEDDESNTCQICLSVWSSHGLHQLCSLKCGHFFGRSCIERVLRDQGRTSRHCPLCNQPAKESDIRLHFAISSFSAKDASKEESLRQQLDQERAARISAEMSEGRVKIRLETAEKELKLLRVSISQTATKSDGGGFLTSPQKKKTDRLTFNVNMGKARAACWISRQYGGVVAGYNNANNKYKLVPVHPDFPNRSTTQLGGLGHDLPIRDVIFRNSHSVCYGGVLATGGLDGKVHMISSTNFNEVCTFTLPDPAWSLAFLRDDALLVGTAKGGIFMFDPRMPKTAVSSLYSGVEPIHSICPVTSHEACATSFTKVTLISDLESAQTVGGLTPRAFGDQYSSMISLGEAKGSVALSVRSVTESFVDVGIVDPRTAEFSLTRKYAGHHMRPSGKIASSEDGNFLYVPDENTKACIEYPTGNRFDEGDQPILGIWNCADSDLCMFLRPNTVDFIKIQ